MDAVTVHSHKESNQNKAPSSITMIGNKLEKNIIHLENLEMILWMKYLMRKFLKMLLKNLIK